MKKLFYSLILFTSLFIFSNNINAEENYTKATCVYDFQYIVQLRDGNQYFNDKLTINLKYENGNLKTSYVNENGNFVVPDFIYNNFISNGSIQCPNYLIQENYEIKETSNNKPDINPNNSYTGYSYGILTDSKYEKTEEVIPNDDIRTCTYKYESDGIVQYEVNVNFNLTKNTMTSNVIGKNGNTSDMFLENQLTFSDYKNNTCPTAYLSINYETNLYGYLMLTRYDPSLPSIPAYNASNIGKYYAALRVPASAYNNSKILNYYVTVNGTRVKLLSIEGNDDICSLEQCVSNPSYYLEKAFRQTTEYCNEVYNKYYHNSNSSRGIAVSDCIDFAKFYNQLVADGVINDYADNCDFITTDLKDKLVFILDLIKIIGPIAAIVLGMLDFIKAVTASDPDKEMKTAFKRLTNRLIAAALLFLIPFILAFVLDLFLGNSDNGYDSDNPFCGLVDWSE